MQGLAPGSAVITSVKKGAKFPNKRVGKDDYLCTAAALPSCSGMSARSSIGLASPSVLERSMGPSSAAMASSRSSADAERRPAVKLCATLQAHLE